MDTRSQLVYPAFVGLLGPNLTEGWRIEEEQGGWENEQGGLENELVGLQDEPGGLGGGEMRIEGEVFPTAPYVHECRLEYPRCPVHEFNTHKRID